MMKRIAVLLLTISTVLCLASGPLRAQQPAANSQRVPTEKNTLIVYLSRTNNTKAIAEIIHQKVGGTLVALEMATPYPADYRETVIWSTGTAQHRMTASPISRSHRLQRARPSGLSPSAIRTTRA